MRILQLCHKPPKPEIDGGCIAMSKISEGLLEAGHELKILTASTHKHPFTPEKIDPEFVASTNIESVFLDTRINIIDAFSAQFIELGNSVLLNLGFTRKTELFFNFQLHRQSVGVPATDTGRVVSLHRLVTRNDILKDRHEDMMNGGMAV